MTPLMRGAARVMVSFGHFFPVFGRFRFRHDDVRQVLLDDDGFDVPYAAKLSRILDIPQGELSVGPRAFMLTMTEGDAHAAQRDRLRAAITKDDLITRLPDAMARETVAETPVRGRFDGLNVMRRAANRVIFAYLGAPAPEAELDVWAAAADTLFRFQFADNRNDTALARRAEPAAARLRAHVAAHWDTAGPDTMMGRLRAAGATPEEARNAVVTFLIAGAPQLIIAAAGVLETLMRRRADLKRARALLDDREMFDAFVLDALRLAPVAPFVARTARKDMVIAEGARRAHAVKKGETVYAILLSAMLDPRRLNAPFEIRADRPASAMAAFGLGRHRCFAEPMARSAVPALVAPFLRLERLEIPAYQGGISRKGGLPTRFGLRLP